MRSLKEAFRPRLMTQRSDEKNVPSHDTVSEKLEVGAARLDDFRAKSSTVYMCLTSEDPILTATYLIERAEKWAFHDSSFSVRLFLDDSTCFIQADRGFENLQSTTTTCVRSSAWNTTLTCGDRCHFLFSERIRGDKCHLQSFCGEFVERVQSIK